MELNLLKSPVKTTIENKSPEFFKKTVFIR